jgi:trehalose 6-phosphate synthase/phosphatase
MAQVIIVSNRLPVSVKKEDGKLSFQPSLGGLATGLASYVSKRNNRWIGWPGIPSDDLTEQDRQEIVTELATHNCSPVFLTKKQIDEFYNGYSNDILWPVFHELPLDDNSEQRDRWWRAYRSVNKAFAEAVLGLLGPDSRIWVHDYQLLLLPAMLREEDIAGSIGFFLHIPFPPAAAFQQQPEYKKLLQGMLGADLIGFHTTGYVENFLENCASLPKVTTQNKKILVDGRSVRVGNFPMGIDYRKFAAANEARNVKEATRRFRKRYKGLKVIAAVDRLDPSKGLLERMQAYKKLLRQNPKLHSKVVFSLIAAPSRTDIPAYKRLSQSLDKLVKDINKTYGTKRWQPVDYINTAQPFEEVAALFSVADVAFIAPIKDGMNLAAKEFVASKQRNGVLVLSETAGAAEELRDALLVNPARPSTLVDGLQKALDMPKKELRSRMLNMQTHLAANNVHNWAKTFVDTLQKPMPGTPTYTRSLQPKLEEKLIQDYRKAKKRLLLLDYDGTLAPFSRNYNDVKPPQQVLRILDLLDNDTRNELVLISGRHADDLRTWFGRLRINLVAEHGAMIKKADSRHWQVMTRSETKWKRAIEPLLEKYTDQTPGAQLEYKAHSLVWHYRGVSPYYAQKYSVIIKRVLKPLVKTYGLQIYQGNKILEIKDPRITKGSAAMRWLRHRYDFILAIGDDYTDEALFNVTPASGYSIKVGQGRTAARYRLQSSADVRKLLTKLTK